MKKVLLALVVCLFVVVLCSCKGKYEKYQEELLNKLPLTITENITLPLTTDDGKYVVRWNSENPEILTNFGRFTKPEKSCQIKLNFSLVENNEIVYNGHFNLAVVGYLPE